MAGGRRLADERRLDDRRRLDEDSGAGRPRSRAELLGTDRRRQGSLGRREVGHPQIAECDRRRPVTRDRGVPDARCAGRSRLARQPSTAVTGAGDEDAPGRERRRLARTRRRGRCLACRPFAVDRAAFDSMSLRPFARRSQVGLRLGRFGGERRTGGAVTWAPLSRRPGGRRSRSARTGPGTPVDR